MTCNRAAIYARISKDDGTALGVGRQVEDCAAEADRKGWTVAATFIDNNVSATRAKARPEYERMLEAVRDGAVDGIIVWDIDRLTRKPTELEVFIDLADCYGLELASVGGEVDLATPQGRLTARIKGSVARHEAEQMGRRIRRQAEQRARDGRSYHGQTPFGYEREGGKLVPHETEAELVREAYRRVLEGETLWAVSRDFTERGIVGKRGRPFVGSVLGHLLHRPVYAGRRTYKGEDVGPGEWEALVSTDTFDRVRAILDAPGRFHTRGTAPKYLLSGIAKCGRCGGTMRPNISTNRAPALVCWDCHKVTRKIEPVDEVVNAVVVAYLENLELDLVDHDEGAHADALRERETLRARLDTAADEYAAGNISARQLSRISASLENDLERADARVRATAPNPALHAIAGPGAAEAWAASPLEQRRSILRELCDVTILPTGPGVRFDPEHVKIEWKA